MNRIKVLNSTLNVKAVWVRVILKLQNFVNNYGFSFISPVTDHNGLYTAVMLRAISTPVQAITGHFIYESMGFHSPTLQLLTSDPANWRHYHQKCTQAQIPICSWWKQREEMRNNLAHGELVTSQTGNQMHHIQPLSLVVLLASSSNDNFSSG